MANVPAGVSDLASSVRCRRQKMGAPDIGEMDNLADSWGTTLDLFGIDRHDPVVGSTVLVAAKMLAHRVTTMVEFGHDAADLQPSLYVTAEAAVVGLNLLEKSRPRPRFHRACAVLAGLALVVSAAATLKPRAVDLPAGLVAHTPGGTAYVAIDAATPAQALEAARAYQAGEIHDLPITVVVTDLVTK